MSPDSPPPPAPARFPWPVRHLISGGAAMLGAVYVVSAVATPFQASLLGLTLAALLCPVGIATIPGTVACAGASFRRKILLWSPARLTGLAVATAILGYFNALPAGVTIIFALGLGIILGLFHTALEAEVWRRGLIVPALDPVWTTLVRALGIAAGGLIAEFVSLPVATLSAAVVLGLGTFWMAGWLRSPAGARIADGPISRDAQASVIISTIRGLFARGPLPRSLIASAFVAFAAGFALLGLLSAQRQDGEPGETGPTLVLLILVITSAFAAILLMPLVRKMRFRLWGVIALAAMLSCGGIALSLPWAGVILFCSMVLGMVAGLVIVEIRDSIHLGSPRWMRGRDRLISRALTLVPAGLGALLGGIVLSLGDKDWLPYWIAAPLLAAGGYFVLSRERLLTEGLVTPGAPPVHVPDALAIPAPISEEDGPWEVFVVYEIRADVASDFEKAMVRLGVFRRQHGAIQWRLQRDEDIETLYRESYLVESWSAYQASLSAESLEERQAKEAVFRLNHWDSLPAEARRRVLGW